MGVEVDDATNCEINVMGAAVIDRDRYRAALWLVLGRARRDTIYVRAKQS